MTRADRRKVEGVLLVSGVSVRDLKSHIEVDCVRKMTIPEGVERFIVTGKQIGRAHV